MEFVYLQAYVEEHQILKSSDEIMHSQQNEQLFGVGTVTI